MLSNSDEKNGEVLCTKTVHSHVGATPIKKYPKKYILKNKILKAFSVLRTTK
jgi:hypothetical protein